LAVIGGATLGWGGVAQGQQQQRQQQPARRPQQPAQPTLPAVTTTASGFPWIDTPAPFAHVVDHDTGAVLLDKNGDQRMFPSSMTKLMTAYIAFDLLAKGELKPETTFRVSDYAAKRGGSTMFLVANAVATVEDLLRGVIVPSGNDACIVLAEGIAGTEQRFAQMMTERARAIGMRDTNYRNASGWPERDHFSTPRDLALLAKRTIDDFPQFYPLYAEREFTYNNVKQPNRNPLLARFSGADGLKTGHTDDAGFGLTASAIRQGRRINLVVNGLTSMRARQVEAERLMNWAFAEFDNYVLVKPGDEVEKAPVWLGEAERVPLTAAAPLVVTLPRRVRKDMKVTLTYDAPLPAPIVKGTRVATLHVTAPTVDPVALPVVAGADVARLGGLGRLLAVAEAAILGVKF
jgi:D-alanyl-D-alanine carboxypeptidase (penicillin-binding protein 5/6)